MRLSFLTLAAALVASAGLHAQCATPQGNALLAIGGLPYPGSSVVFSVAATPGLPLALAFDTGAGPLPFPGGGTICLGPTASFLTSLFGPFMLVPQTGVWSMSTAIPNDLTLVGATFHFQAGVVDATAPNGKIAFSNGASLTIAPQPSYTVVFYDGFETNPPQGYGPWTATNGLWARGMPTAGPQAAFAGNWCAATNPNGPDYVHSGENSIWRSPVISLPQVGPAEALLLRYRVWFTTEEFWDYMQPLVLPNPAFPSSTWQTVPIPPSSGVGDSYTEAGCDLTAYAGQQIRIGFQFVSRYSGNFGGVAGPGFFLDEVRVLRVSGLPMLGSAENWDSPQGSGLWTVDNGIWEVGTPPASVPAGNTLPPQPFSGGRIAATILGLNYPSRDVNSRLISPPFVVPPPQPGSPIVELFWMQWLDMPEPIDFGRVDYSADGGLSWLPLGGNISAISHNWTQASVVLADANGSLSGQTIQIAFYFESNYSGNFGPVAGAGWFVDDIFVQ